MTGDQILSYRCHSTACIYFVLSWWREEGHKARCAHVDLCPGMHYGMEVPCKEKPSSPPAVSLAPE